MTANFVLTVKLTVCLGLLLRRQQETDSFFVEVLLGRGGNIERLAPWSVILTSFFGVSLPPGSFGNTTFMPTMPFLWTTCIVIEQQATESELYNPRPRRIHHEK